MSEDQFLKIFKYMQVGFSDARAELSGFKEETRQNFDRVYGILDTQSKILERLDQERLFANRQLDLHEDWITRAAPAVKVPYRTELS